MSVSAPPAEPSLPRLYELVRLERADSALAEACRRARAGAEEGTLVWVGHESAGEGRGGRRWHGAREGLYAALVLRPAMALEEAAEVVFVAGVALGQAVADQVPALVEMHYRWPNGLLLRHGRLAGIQLRAGPLRDGLPDWLVLGIAVNVVGAPPQFGFGAASLREDGEASAGAGVLLEGFARYFLSWVDRWAQEGIAPVLKAWQRRFSVPEPELRLEVGGREHCGRFSALGPRGEMILTASDGSPHRLPVTAFFELDAGESR